MPKKEKKDQPRILPPSPSCRFCGNPTEFFTHTGGGAGMVFLIFKCTVCGKCTPLK